MSGNDVHNGLHFENFEQFTDVEGLVKWLLISACPKRKKV